MIDPISSIQSAAPSSASFFFSEQIATNNQTIYDRSTISPATKIDENIVWKTPQLDPPSYGNGFGNFLGTYTQKVEPLAENWKHYLVDQSEQSINTLRNCEKDIASNLQEAIDRGSSTQFWGILSDISTSVQAAVSFLIGAQAVTSGSFVLAGALIGAGVLSIGNLAFKYGGVWDALGMQLQESWSIPHQVVSTVIPAMIGLACTATAIYGSYVGGKLLVDATLKTIHKTLNLSGLIAKSTLDAAGNFSQRKQAYIEANQAELGILFSLTLSSFDYLTKSFTSFERIQSNITESVANTLRQNTSAIQITQQPV